MNEKKNSPVIKILVYLAGLMTIALGINISKLAGLGISPVSSVPRALEVVWGFTLGRMVIVSYCLMVFGQFLVLRKDFRTQNILGVPVAIVFGWMVDFLGIDPRAFGHLLLNFPRPGSYPVQLLYLAVSIVVIGIGVYVYLKPSLVPMPAEGLAQAISQVSGKAFGDCKTIVDCTMIGIALMLQLIFLGGLSSFTGETVVVREGTVLAAFFVGQTVKFIKKKFDRQNA